MPNKCTIISGGMRSAPIRADDSELIIACDKGYEYAKQQGIRPHMVVGDFDSFSGEIEAGVEIKRYPREKDDTDTMLAVRHAVAQGFLAVELYCALGGRFDHTYANLQAAAFGVSKGAQVVLRDEDTLIYAIAGQTLSIHKQEGYALSVFAYTDACRGVTLKGLQYPLENATLTNLFPVGVSNGFAQEVAEISVREGILFIMLSKQA